MNDGGTTVPNLAAGSRHDAVRDGREYTPRRSVARARGAVVRRSRTAESGPGARVHQPGPRPRPGACPDGGAVPDSGAERSTIGAPMH